MSMPKTREYRLFEKKHVVVNKNLHQRSSPNLIGAFLIYRKPPEGKRVKQPGLPIGSAEVPSCSDALNLQIDWPNRLRTIQVGFSISKNWVFNEGVISFIRTCRVNARMWAAAISKFRSILAAPTRFVFRSMFLRSLRSISSSVQFKTSSFWGSLSLWDQCSLSVSFASVKSSWTLNVVVVWSSLLEDPFKGYGS